METRADNINNPPFLKLDQRCLLHAVQKVFRNYTAEYKSGKIGT